MSKRAILLLVLGLFALGHLGKTPGYGQEAAGYDDEAPGYSEEAAGYGEEAAGYGEEAPGYGEEVPAYREEGIAQLPPPTMAREISAPADKPKSLDELIMWYDSTSCKECHKKIYQAWERSHHARPLMGINNLVFMGPVLRRGVLALKNPNEASARNFPCFKCHLPQAMNLPAPVYAQIARAVLSNDKKKLRKLNIGCIVCHNEIAIIHKLQDGRPEEDVVYGNNDVREHKDEVYRKVKKSPIMKRAVMCGQCHGLGPNLEFENPVQCATLYGSYLHAYLPTGSARTCQECHMKDRDHTFLPDFNRRAETSAMLAEAISLEVEAQGYQFISQKNSYAPLAAVKTTVTSRAGHRVPDG